MVLSGYFKVMAGYFKLIASMAKGMCSGAISYLLYIIDCIALHSLQTHSTLLDAL